MLKRLIRPPVLYVDHIEGRGVGLFEATCGRDLEGIVAKLAAGRYEPAATTWVKIKNRRIGKRRAGPISLRSPAPGSIQRDLEPALSVRYTVKKVLEP
jgi:hypothetical protein